MDMPEALYQGMALAMPQSSSNPGFQPLGFRDPLWSPTLAAQGWGTQNLFEYGSKPLRIEGAPSFVRRCSVRRVGDHKWICPEAMYQGTA